MKKFLLYVLPLAAIFALASMLPADAGVTPSSQTTIRSPTPVLNGPILSGRVLNIGETQSLVGVDPRTAGTFQRPIGSFLYDRSGTLTYIKTGTLATAWEPLGAGSISGSANAYNARIARAATLTGISASLLTCWRDEYAYNPSTIAINSNSGSGSVGMNTGDFVGGRLTVSSGATAASAGLHTSASTMLGRPDTNRFYFAARWAMTTTPDAQTSVGLGAAVNALNNGFTIGVCGATSTTLYAFNRDGIPPCSGTVVTTAVSIVVNAMHVMEVWGVGDSKEHVAIDGNEIAGSPFTLASSPTNSMRTYITAKNGTTAANQAIDVDYYMLCWSET